MLAYFKALCTAGAGPIATPLSRFNYFLGINLRGNTNAARKPWLARNQYPRVLARHEDRERSTALWPFRFDQGWRAAVALGLCGVRSEKRMFNYVIRVVFHAVYLEQLHRFEQVIGLLL